MAALAACREFDDGSFEHFEERLLHALVAGIGGDGVVRAGFSGDFVEFVEVDDAVLGFFNVLVCRIVEVSYGDFYIRADEAGFGEA